MEEDTVVKKWPVCGSTDGCPGALKLEELCVFVALSDCLVLCDFCWTEVEGANPTGIRQRGKITCREKTVVRGCGEHELFGYLYFTWEYTALPQKKDIS